jgi:hypothetical protein
MPSLTSSMPCHEPPNPLVSNVEAGNPTFLGWPLQFFAKEIAPMVRYKPQYCNRLLLPGVLSEQIVSDSFAVALDY